MSDPDDEVTDEVPFDPTGLDLARQIARAARGGPPAQPRRRRTSERSTDDPMPIGEALAWTENLDLDVADRARASALLVEVMLFGNELAQRFYERGGWTTDGTRRTATVWGVEVDEIEYRRRL